MNWTCLVYGAPMLFALLWFAIDARKWFKGPRVNAKHAMIGQVMKELGWQNYEPSISSVKNIEAGPQQVSELYGTSGTMGRGVAELHG